MVEAEIYRCTLKSDRHNWEAVFPEQLYVNGKTFERTFKGH
jgi:hypothetical protein